MRNALLVLIALLSTLCGSAAALELSDIHMPMKRLTADNTLSKDYTYSVLADGSVRRTWHQSDRDVIIDFDTVSNDAIMVAVVYHKPVAKSKGIADAHVLADGKCDESASWESPKNNDAKRLIEDTYGLKNARRKKLEGEAMLFYETDAQKKHIVRVSLFARMPHTNRWALSVLTKGSGRTAMGNQMSASFIASLYEDEEKRQQSAPAADTTTTSADGAGDQPVTPTFTVSVTRRTTPTPEPKPDTPATPAKPTPPTKHTASSTPTTATPTTATAPTAPGKTTAPRTTTTTTTTTTKPSEPALEPGRHTMTLLPPPPDWLKKIGVEDPTWWHYLGVGIVLLLILVFIIRSIFSGAQKAAQRRRFAEVVAQGQPRRR